MALWPLERKIMKIGIGIDGWKLPIFTRHLSEANYEYTVRPGLIADTLLITVVTANLDPLKAVVQAADAEAAKTGERE
jgi:hypothetical protein